MADALWISPSGKRRKGTSVQELQDIFSKHITTRHIFEPLHATSINVNSTELLNDLDHFDFDVIGVIDETERVTSYLVRDELRRHLTIVPHAVDLSVLVADSTPIVQLVKLLSEKDFLFVMHSSNIEGIVTKADLNKPVVRLYIFGLLSLFEMHLSWWIWRTSNGDSWKSHIKPERLNEAERMFEKKRATNTALSLVDCLQVCDKRDVLLKTRAFCQNFALSRNKFDSMVGAAEVIRNELAHSQRTINGDLNWKKFSNTVLWVEEFITKSDERIVSKT